jgi:cardiolipin synthase
VPNLLTYARILAVPVVVACLYWQDILQGGLWLRWVALVIFIGAGVTDVLACSIRSLTSSWSRPAC